jgi:hypothetical protein
MEKIKLYQYVGDNGLLLTPIKIEGASYQAKLRLVAKDGYQLTKDNVNYHSSVTIPESEESEWREVKGQK